MAITNFTPGPWRLICTRNRKVIEYVTIQQDDGTPYGNRVAGINADEISETNKEVVSNEALANARLIAAAPDLYTVLDAFLSDLDESGDVGFTIRQRARALLNKVEGLTP